MLSQEYRVVKKILEKKFKFSTKSKLNGLNYNYVQYLTLYSDMRSFSGENLYKQEINLNNIKKYTSHLKEQNYETRESVNRKGNMLLQLQMLLKEYYTKEWSKKDSDGFSIIDVKRVIDEVITEQSTINRQKCKETTQNKGNTLYKLKQLLKEYYSIEWNIKEWNGVSVEDVKKIIDKVIVEHKNKRVVAIIKFISETGIKSTNLAKLKFKDFYAVDEYLSLIDSSSEDIYDDSDILDMIPFYIFHTSWNGSKRSTYNKTVRVSKGTIDLICDAYGYKQTDFFYNEENDINDEVIFKRKNLNLYGVKDLRKDIKETLVKYDDDKHPKLNYSTLVDFAHYTRMKYELKKNRSYEKEVSFFPEFSGMEIDFYERKDEGE